MAKLLTHHDRFHVHAILGIIALLHFVGRFCYSLAIRSESFDQSWASCALLAVHICLPLLSFQFPLPQQRQHKQPMIWREFRMHSFIFASRHIVACYFAIFCPEIWWREPTAVSVMLKLCLILLVGRLADMATELLRDETSDTQNLRTTNAMSYPQGTSVALEKTAKMFYAKSQFAATSFVAYGTPSMVFIAAFPIQGAAFLMTLVRKGKISPGTYHAIYAALLAMNFPVILAVLYGDDDKGVAATFRALCTTFISCTLRMECGFNKYTTWALAIIGGCVLGLFTPGFVMFPLMVFGMSWSLLDTVIRILQASKMNVASGVEGNFAEIPGLTFSGLVELSKALLT